jgi:hypothetical protein
VVFISTIAGQIFHDLRTRGSSNYGAFPCRWWFHGSRSLKVLLCDLNDERHKGESKSTKIELNILACVITWLLRDYT